MGLAVNSCGLIYSAPAIGVQLPVLRGVAALRRSPGLSCISASSHLRALLVVELSVKHYDRLVTRILVRIRSATDEIPNDHSALCDRLRALSCYHPRTTQRRKHCL